MDGQPDPSAADICMRESYSSKGAKSWNGVIRSREC